MNLLKVALHFAGSGAADDFCHHFSACTTRILYSQVGGYRGRHVHRLHVPGDAAGFDAGAHPDHWYMGVVVPGLTM